MFLSFINNSFTTEMVFNLVVKFCHNKVTVQNYDTTFNKILVSTRVE